jgi:cyclic beta-1,2-glucan glucanotransferase
MYRLGAEWLLGFRARGATLHLDPCIPRAWRSFEIMFRYHSTQYRVTVENPMGATRGILTASVDEVALESGRLSVALADDGALHHVHVMLG